MATNYQGPPIPSKKVQGPPIPSKKVQGPLITRADIPQQVNSIVNSTVKANSKSSALNDLSSTSYSPNQSGDSTYNAFKKITQPYVSGTALNVDKNITPSTTMGAPRPAGNSDLKDIQAGINTADALTKKLSEGSYSEKGTYYPNAGVADGFKRDDDMTWNSNLKTWVSPEDAQRIAFNNAQSAPKKIAETPTPTTTTTTTTPTPTTETGFLIDGVPVSRDAYISDRLNKYMNAYKLGDQATIDSLKADAQARGYAGELDRGFYSFTNAQGDQTAPTDTSKGKSDTPSTEEAFRIAAQKQVDEQNAKKNADLDLQIKQATENRDFATAEQLKAYKTALNDIKNQSFLSGSRISQGMANRGLLNSGMYADALLRSDMGSQQQIRQLSQTRESNINKAVLGYNQTLEKINKAKSDIASGNTKDVETLTKQMVSDQQTADKYKADILKAQADKTSADAKQTFEYISMLAKENNYDISGLMPYAINNDIEGMTKWLQNTGNLKMSQAGKEIQAVIDAKKAEVGVSQSATAENLAQAAKGWSDIFGIATDPNGNPIKDKKGNVIPTQTVKEASAKLQLEAEKSKQASNLAAQGNALGWAKLGEVTKYHQALIDKEDKQVQKALDMDKESSTRDYFKSLLDDSTKVLNNAHSALSYNPKDQTLLAQYNTALDAHKLAMNNIKKYYADSGKSDVVQMFPLAPTLDFTNGSYLKSVDWKKDSSLGTSKSGK
jgi:hypothetical protein